MPIFRGNRETLGYTPSFENYVCCLCFEELEEDTLYIDEKGIKWDICKECQKLNEQSTEDIKKKVWHTLEKHLGMKDE